MRKIVLSADVMLTHDVVFEMPVHVVVPEDARLEMDPNAAWKHIETDAAGQRFAAMFVFLPEAAGSMVEVHGTIVGPAQSGLTFALFMEVGMRGERPVACVGRPILHGVDYHLIRVRPEPAGSGDWQAITPEGPWA